MPKKPISSGEPDFRIDLNADSKDPYLKLLDDALDKNPQNDTVRNQSLSSLLALHYKNPKRPFDGYNAVILAGRGGIPAPPWAIELLQQAAADCIKEGYDLAAVLGFKGSGKGQTKNADVRVRLQDQLREQLCLNVRRLVLLGKSSNDACRMVADQLKCTAPLNFGQVVSRF